MNKAPRFMKEYAKYKTLNILRNELMKEEFKNKGCPAPAPGCGTMPVH